MRQVRLGRFLNLKTWCSTDFGQWESEAHFIREMAPNVSIELIESMDQNGQDTPIWLRRCDDWCETDRSHHILMNGHHRLLAAMLLGWDTIGVTYSRWPLQAKPGDSGTCLDYGEDEDPASEMLYNWLMETHESLQVR